MHTPTMTLRFVDREEESNLTADGHLLPHDVVRVIKRRVLQQMWVSAYVGEPSLWRDVPLENETPNVEFSGTPAASSPEAPLERRVGPGEQDD